MSASFPPGMRPSVMQLVLPYWKSKESWLGRIILALLLTLSFTGVYISIWSNELAGKVVDAMVARRWEGLWQVLLTSLGVATLAVITSLLSAYLLAEMLNYQWRSWMTRWLVEAWTRSSNFYDIELDGRVDNVDQRIAQDVDMFTRSTQSLVLGTLTVIVMTVSFTVVLWKLSGTLNFTLGGYQFAIKGYMVYVAYAYAIGSLLISHLFGRQLIALFNKKQTVEADFRYSGMQLRENAEQVAFYDGGIRERQRLMANFEEVKANWRAIMIRTIKMTLARDTYVQAGSILPTAASLPKYLSGAISLGDVTRITGAFNTLYGGLSYFTQAYVNFAEWLAVANRLRDLVAVIRYVEGMPRGISVSNGPHPDISSSPIELNQPSGPLIAQMPALGFQPGERWIIRGASGAGKSTLLRAIAGMWPHGSGQVTRPGTGGLMFLPQRSYIPMGTLKSALCYPAEAYQIEDESCREVLDQVHLPHLIARLDEVDRWQQRLSGGEQQRLAIARAILHQPTFLFLDEATSALDPAMERALYTALRERLPNTALISVAHRKELEEFHDHVLQVGPEPAPRQ